MPAGAAPHRRAGRRRRRLPIVLQLTATECGAACLAMILAYHGRQTSLAECREHCNPGRDGLTAATIATAGRHLGLLVKAYSVDLSQIRQVRLPAIAHWDFNHFVVLERWSPGRVDIVDPAVGRRRLRPEEFSESFTGVILAMEPGPQFGRLRPPPRASWHRYALEILQTPGVRPVLGQILLASLLLQVLGLMVPVLTKIVVDHVIPFGMITAMPILGAGMLVLALTEMVSSYLRAALVIGLQARVDSRLMLGFFEHVLALPFRFFQQRSSGDLLMRLGSNAAVRETLTTETTAAILDGAFVVVYLLILFSLAPLFGTIVLGLGFLQVTVLLASTRPLYRAAQREIMAEADSDSYLVEALVGIGTLKASGAERRAFDHWSRLFHRHLGASLRRGQLAAAIDAALGLLQTISPLLLLWVGTLQVLDGSMSLGTMLALVALGSAVLAPLGSLVKSGQRLQMARAHIDRLMDVVHAEAEPARPTLAARMTGRIAVRHLSFRYQPRAPWVLRDITLTIEPGQKVAVIGPSGSGKSTLAMLLLGLHQPTEGEILYDGIPLPELDFRALRSQWGTVLQDSGVFSGSIRQTIAFNDPSLPMEAVVRAARLAEIHDEIAAMPMGYDTLMAEGGAGLSGGQIQRLCLARALARAPAMLLLDEATSHVDTETEARIERNLAGLGCTRVLIAHRLSTVRNADQIVLLDAGAIVEHGVHDSLVSLGGRYARLARGGECAEGVPSSNPASAGLATGAVAR